MADYRSLVIVSGVTRQLVDTDRLIAGSGITSAPSQNLAIDAPSGQNVTIGATTATSVGIGSATAPVNVGGTLNANTIDRATAGALSIGATNATSVAVGKAGVAVTMAGGALTPSVDTAAAGALTIGGTNATSVAVGKAGVAVTAAGGILTTSVGRSSSGTLSVGTDANTTAVAIGSATAPVNVGGLLTANTFDRATAGALTIGGTNATSVSVGKAGVPVTAAGGLLSPSLDVASAGTLSIGTTTATGITVGKVGVLTTIAGDLQVNGAETVIGLSTFTGDAQFNGNVVFGNAQTDTVSFYSVIGNGTYNDFIFSQTADHSISLIDAANDVLSRTLNVRGGKGGNAVTANGKTGGQVYLRGGEGGAGAAATYTAGAGGPVAIFGGSGGIDNGAGGATGGGVLIAGGPTTTNASAGAVTLRGGAAGSSLWYGEVKIGDAQTSAIRIGNHTDDPTLYIQTSGDCYCDIPNWIYLGTLPAVEFYWQDKATALVAGGYTWHYGQKGGPSSGASAGGTGGNWNVTAGTGGDGSATAAAGAGGGCGLAAGTGGLANGGVGGNGGIISVSGGAGTGTAGTGGSVRIIGGNSTSSTKGTVYVGYQYTSHLYLGNTTDNTPITQQGTGNFTITGDIYHNNNYIYFDNSQDHNLKVSDTTTLSAVGRYLNLESGYGGNTSGAAAGGVGGAFYVAAGDGGAGSATQPAGVGGQLSLWSGSGGVANGGAGANGGNVSLRAGNGTGTAGNGGHVYIGAGNSTSGIHGNVYIGDVAPAYDAVISVLHEITLTADRATGGITGIVNVNGALKLLEQTSAPAASANHGSIYVADDGGDTELFWRDETHAALQITKDGQLNVTIPASYFTGTARESLNLGAPACLNYDGANNGVFHADANGTGTGRQRCIGLMYAAATSGNPAYVTNAAEQATPDAVWDAVPATTDVGKPAYLSENVGKLTLTAPSTSGSVVQVVGVVSAGGTGAVKVLVQPQAPVLL